MKKRTCWAVMHTEKNCLITVDFLPKLFRTKHTCQAFINDTFGCLRKNAKPVRVTIEVVQ